MANIVIVWDKRVEMSGGPTSAPNESNVNRVTCDATTPMATLVQKIRNAAAGDQVSVLRIFAHGGSSRGGKVALAKEGLNKDNVFQFGNGIRGIFADEGRIELHSCLVAKDAGTVASDSWIMLSSLAIVSGAYVYAGEEVQVIAGGKNWDPDWEGTVWIFPPSGP